jgi:hypothetical protein
MIDFFWNEYRFLSNFYSSPILYEGILYPTVEHAYQAQKTADVEVRKQMANCKTPKEVKAMGYKVAMIEDWDNNKLWIMHELLKLKFADETLKNMLLATGDEELVEGNTWGDTYWGICKGIGENNLGKLLMAIRSTLKIQSIRSNYRIQNGCHNCKNAFNWYDYDSGIELYCMVGGAPRPPCLSAAMKEDYGLGDERWPPEGASEEEKTKFMEESDKKWEKAHAAWENWSESRQVYSWSICDKWVLSKGIQ